MLEMFANKHLEKLFHSRINVPCIVFTGYLRSSDSMCKTSNDVVQNVTVAENITGGYDIIAEFYSDKSNCYSLRSQSKNSDDSQNKPLSTSIITTIVVGCVVLICIIIGVVICIKQKKCCFNKKEKLNDYGEGI